MSRAEHERLLLPTKATPPAASAKIHDFGWKARVAPGSVAVSTTRVRSEPAAPPPVPSSPASEAGKIYGHVAV
ncbi:MAG TPA: hypothetical protein PLU22_09485, partial [Polyangiaceae bacterium]|nr:hypothetical protein [Polyangiaceae bacterium]